MSYKETLNLPQTKFEMRAGLNKKEPKIIEKWKQIDLYNKMREKNKGNEDFFLHDGPIYANGDIHVGHALNRLLKDFCNKSKSMNGYLINFIPGWDTHGLPIAQKVTELGIDRKTMSNVEFRKHCREYAYNQIAIQKEQFKRIGMIGRFDDVFITDANLFESRQLEVFFTMYEKGLIKKGLKPIFWSPSSESALAQAEIEYHDKVSPSIYVGYEVSKGNEFIKQGEKILIWTTTPWTIPANTGVAIGKNIEYLKVKGKDNIKYLVAKECLENVSKEVEMEFEIIEELRSEQIVGIEYNHPLGLRVGKVVYGHHVDTESGTGLVHMAPAHGEEDFVICKNEGLEIVNYIDEKGHFFNDAPLFAGEFWLKANNSINDMLKEKGALVGLKTITHSYPHDWRTRKPVMYKATPQWFCSIEKIKDEILNSIKEINWIPKWGENRLTKMMIDREDWCISRQRIWGVPIPIFYAENKEPINDPLVNKHIVKLFEEFGSDVWFDRTAKDLLPKGYSHPNSPNGVFIKEMDIMDVWFDSGSSHYGFTKVNHKDHKSSLYFEGSDQFRGWFNSSTIISTAVNGSAPCQTLISHGFVLDGKGEKMSKSKGNVINPLEVVENKGADIIRLWVASTKYFADVRISNEIIDQMAEYYRGIRFKIRFALSNLYDFDYSKHASDKFSSYDKYALMLIQKYNQDCIKWYDKYSFGDIFNETNNLLNRLSTEYFDYTKDILYIYKANSQERRAIQTVMYHFIDVVTRVLAPIISFTAEEAYGHFNKIDKKDSVLLEDMKVKEFIKYDPNYIDKVNKIIDVKNDIYKKIEELRVAGRISKSGQCNVVASLKDEYKDIVDFENLEQYLMLASLKFEDKNVKDLENCTGEFRVSKTEALACGRCRSFKHDLDKDLCLNCKKIIG